MNAALKQICACTWKGNLRVFPHKDCPVHDPGATRRRTLERKSIEFSEALKELNFQFALLPKRISAMKRNLEQINERLRELDRESGRI